MSYVTCAQRRDLLPPLLTADEEVELALAIEAGTMAEAVLDGLSARPDGATDDELRAVADAGLAAWQRFMGANLRLVALLADEACTRYAMDFDEVFQQGCLGLAEALHRFDALRGSRFASYAASWVRNEMRNCCLRRGGRVEATVWQVRAAVQLKARWAALESGSGRSVGLDELARSEGRDVTWVQQTLTMAEPTPMAADLSMVAGECEGAARAFDDVAAGRPEWIDALAPREAAVLALRFGLDDGRERGYDECARSLRMSESTVRRAERAALGHARQLLAHGHLAAA